MNYEEIVQQSKDVWYAEWDVAHPHNRLRILPASDLSSLCAAIPAPKHGDEWGNWKLNLRGEPSLDFADGDFYYEGNPYWIELSKLHTDEGIVERLSHLNQKIWFGHEPTNAGNFVNAVFQLREYVFKKVPKSPIKKAVKKGMTK
jgi:hypothetical protein